MIEQVHVFLNDLFSFMDDEAERQGIQKIKTIGTDCSQRPSFIAVSHRSDDHPSSRRLLHGGCRTQHF
jgi:hypothetical protein